MPMPLNRPTRSRIIRTAAALALSVTGAIALQALGSAHAAKSATFYVGLTPGNNSSCASPGYIS